MAKAGVGFVPGWKARARRSPEAGEELEMGTGTGAQRIVESPFLETSQTQLDMFLCHLL